MSQAQRHIFLLLFSNMKGEREDLSLEESLTFLIKVISLSFILSLPVFSFVLVPAGSITAADQDSWTTGSESS